MANVKAGDLAIVINAIETPEMIGRIIEVVRSANNKEKFPGFSWVNSAGGVVWIIRGLDGSKLPIRTKSNQLIFNRERPFTDIYLRPVSGIPDAELTKTERKIEVKE